MVFKETPLEGAYLAYLDPHSDPRGTFVRMFCKKEFQAIGFNKEVTQINFSRTEREHSIRGMHYRKSEGDECKFLCCLKGKIYDVIIDLRRLSANDNTMLFMPEGFAHGFQSLEPGSEVIYFHTGFYDSKHDMGLRYNDTALGITWPFPITDISAKDAAHPLIDRTFRGI
jgi:dTDP-4-dehydrorhamnose 3,5-epimerase